MRGCVDALMREVMRLRRILSPGAAHHPLSKEGFPECFGVIIASLLLKEGAPKGRKIECLEEAQFQQ